jgi:hypothetical protein
MSKTGNDKEKDKKEENVVVEEEGRKYGERNER